MGPISLARLELVHPVLALLTRILEVQLGQEIGVTQGFRPAKEQAALYAQGRQTLDQVNQLRVKVGWAPITEAENVVVTAAAPGYSWHEFGCAVDVVPENTMGVPDWNINHPVWQKLVKMGESLGLRSGISWKDEPHFQWTGIFPVTPNDEVRQLFAWGGTIKIWQFVQFKG
jgi:peptidoglycan L-alanyl-D-glutamate endopeptidase CwlK